MVMVGAGHMSKPFAKPKPKQAMQLLLTQIQQQLPFGMSEAEICAGKCIGCPKKLMEYMSMETDHWQAQLDAGQPILLGDISRLAHISKKVCRSLARNGLVSSVKREKKIIS
jgi:hypothetical protein